MWGALSRMPPESPSPRSQQSSPTPTATSQRLTGYADAARRSTSTKNSNRKSISPNTSIVLYNGPHYDAILNTDPAMLAIARSQNPNSIIFNMQQLCTSSEVEDILVEQLGTVVALSTRLSSQKQLLVEALFKTEEQKKKALESGVIVKNERILGLPHVAADTNLVKINLYQLPVCDPTELTEELRLALTAYGKVAQI
ncbi:hypothetical protein BDB00DRAFT_920312 [Zychaea mexicana]|uniref:uncharacterized protein n=1 Tax=Zychaea mexicana TaxID=64656 RepID=UPI0022FF1EFC|nr:uncharacterized protein BDB00DRAFT_920312 [Zychaea mexicana]KAI9489516.1 hypothetical protein BDB00DRAFT_920312 [Zychaea mexicana]